MKILIKAFFLLFALTGVANATVGSLVASQTSCTAPCPVHFDATGTTDPTVGNPFKDLRYVFEFDDVTSGTWSTDGLSKNRESGGPLAAHVFDGQGTFNVNLKVGDDLTTAVTITVADPDVTWSGTDTICLSTGADFSGCPSGATESTITAWPTWASNRRYMLREGDDFTALSGISYRQLQDIRITSYGSGAKPIVSSVTTQRSSSSYPTTGDSWIKNADVIGLEVQYLLHTLTGRHIFYYQNTITNGANGIQWAWSMNQNYGTYPNMYTPQNLFTIDNVMTTGPSNKSNGEGQMIWMGNVISHTGEHNLRWFSFYKGVAMHNRFLGHSAIGGKASMKIHAGGFDVISDPDNFLSKRPASSYAVISHNLMRADVNIWSTGTAKPQDRVLGEGIENVIYEFNTHEQSTGTSANAGAYAGRVIVRRGEIHLGGIGCPSPGHLEESLPVEWQGPYHVGTVGSCYLDEPIPPEPTGGGGGAANIQITSAVTGFHQGVEPYELQYPDFFVTVINTGDVTDTYNLTVDMYPGSSITKNSLFYMSQNFVGSVGTITTPFNSGDLVVENESIDPGETQTWIIDSQWNVDQDTVTDTVGSAQCDPSTNTAVGGMAYLITTDRPEDSVTNNKGCVDAFVYDPAPPTGGVEISQIVTTLPVTGDEQTVVYTITAVNSDTSARTYDISETFYVGAGITVSTITAPTIVYATGAGESNSGRTSPFTGSGGLLVDTENIDASATETWTVTVVYTIDHTVLTPVVGSALCGTSGRTSVGGFSMVVSTDAVDDDPLNDRACTEAVENATPPADSLVTICWPVSVPIYKFTGEPTSQEITDVVTDWESGSLTVEYQVRLKCEKGY